MKKQTLKKTACTVAVAMALTGLVGCGKKEEKNTTQEATETTTTEAVNDSETSEVSDATEDANIEAVDITQYPWVLSHEFSDAEYLTLPEGADFCGIPLPITKETLSSMPYGNSLFPSIDAARAEPANRVYLKVEDSAYPTLNFDVEGMTVGEVFDTNQYFMDVAYLNYTNFGFSKEDFVALKNAHDLKEQEIYLDIMTTMYGTPNYFRYFASDTDVKTLIYNMMNPENANNNLNNTSTYTFIVGWQFEDFGISAYFAESGCVTDKDYSTMFGSNMSIYYYPIESGTLEDHYQETYGENIVSALIAERKNAFGDVEFLGPDPAVQELVSNRATPSDAATSSGTTDINE